MTPILSVDDVKTYFGGIKAVDGVTMQLEQGKLYGIVGPNGSGKTTLVNAITRMGPLTAGTVTFDGVDVSSVPAHALSKRGLARTFQSIRLIRTLTVRDNIRLGSDHAGTERSGRDLLGAARRTAQKRANEIADEAIEKLGLERVADDYPSNLPYGTQRRVEIARAIASGPKVLLLDEPVAGMNREERQEIGAVIKSLKEQGYTQLMIEHDLRMMLELCDHLFVMNFGKCVADGEPRATAALPIVQEAYLGKGHVVA